MARLLISIFLSIPLIGAFAMLALGISVIYRASRVLNLAHGAMAMVSAYVFYTVSGKLGLPVIVGVFAAVLTGALLGVGVEYVFVRRLRAQGPTAQTVGTVAATGLLISLAAKIWGTNTVLAPGIFPQGSVRIAGAAVSFGALGLFGVGMLVSAGLFAFFRFTEVGLAMRGAAQNRRAASLMGINPDHAAVAAWAMGGALAALAGVLLAAITNLDPYNLSLQALPAFVAVLIGGMESLLGAVGGAAVAGLAFGLIPVLSTIPGIGRVFLYAGASQLMLALLAVGVMAARGRRYSGVEAAEAGFTGGRAFRRPDPRKVKRAFLVAGAFLLLWPWVIPYSVLGDSLLAMEYAVVAISLVLLIGWVGQISLAQASFVGIGALIMAMVSRGFGLAFPLNLLVGALTAGIAAVILGTVALRVRGLYLAVATLIFAWMADQFLFHSPWLGMATGSSTLPDQHLGQPGGFVFFDFTSRRTLYFVMIAVVVVVVGALANLRDTRTGRAFFAIRGSEVAAASLGIDVVRYKLAAFALSGLVAGIGGGLLMMDQRTVVPDQFLFIVSLQYLAIAVVGGLTSLGGSIAAGVVFAGLNELFFRVQALSGWLEVVSAGLLAAVLLLYPGGLAAIPDGLRRFAERSRLLKRARVVAGSRWDRMAERAATTALERARAAGTLNGSSDGSSKVEGTQAAETKAPIRVGSFVPEGAPLPADRADRTPVLDATGITVRFGGLTAVRDASLSVREGEIVGLIGPNGAGKTTFFNAILGLNEPADGRIELGGVDATKLPPHRRASLGVARTFQVIQLFNELTVFDNLLVATHLRNRSGLLSNLAAGAATIRHEKEARDRVREVLGVLDLEDYAERGVRGLPFGILRMVELGRALVAGGTLLMLDEPASGLNDAETDRLIAVVRRIRGMDVSVLLIEHDVRMVTGISDYVYVLDQGRVIADGTPASIRRDPAVVAAYLGGEAEDEPVEVNA